MRTALVSAIFVVLFLSLIGVSLLFPEPGYACSCIRPGPPSEALEESAMVFEGEVVSLRLYERPGGIWSSADPVTVEFEVRTIWKGYDYQTFYLTTPRSDASCGFRFVVGEEYLVYSRNAVTVDICSRTSLLSEAEDDLEELGDGQSPTPGAAAPTPVIPEYPPLVVPTPVPVEPAGSASVPEAPDDRVTEELSPAAEADVPTPETSEGVAKTLPSPKIPAEQPGNSSESKVTEEPTGGGCTPGSAGADVSLAGLLAGLVFLGLRKRRSCL